MIPQVDTFVGLAGANYGMCNCEGTDAFISATCNQDVYNLFKLFKKYDFRMDFGLEIPVASTIYCAETTRCLGLVTKRRLPIPVI